jgi:hypothetical protein
MKSYRAWSFAIALFIGSLVAAAPVGENVDRAQTAASAWLSLLDSAKFERSWKESATLFRSAVPEAEWVSTIASVRAPLGSVVSRKLKAASYTTTLPGAPPGEYVVIQYTTDFANRSGAVETVTPMLDGGAWRVSGYYVK